MPITPPDVSLKHWLLCRVGQRLYALPIENVVETLRLLPVEPVTHSPPFVLGLCILRGSPVVVVDAGLLFGEHGTRPERLVTIRVGSRIVALAVDSVVGLQAIGAGASEALPPILNDASDVVAAVGTLDAELLIFLHTIRAAPEALLDSVQTEETPP